MATRESRMARLETRCFSRPLSRYTDAELEERIHTFEREAFGRTLTEDERAEVVRKYRNGSGKQVVSLTQGRIN